jgi:aspartate racemase
MNAPVSTAGMPGLIGVLGGMGPLATIDFMHKLLNATPASIDQDHVPVIVSSIPQVPDRTAAFRGEGVSPLAAMVASGQRLARAGAGLVVIPCNTAHLWFEKIQIALDLPMLHLVDAALEDAVDSVGSGGTIGLLCTDATLASGLYMNRARQGGADVRVQWALPTASEMMDLVMPGIDAVKAGDLSRGRELLEAAALALVKRGAQALVLGCTEIPLVLARSNVSVPVIDATASLARRAVAWSVAQRELAQV